MANFEIAYNNTNKNEGGWVNDPDDSGGETYAGIARNIWPKWSGWAIVDSYKNKPNFPKNMEGDLGLKQQHYDFYKKNFWNTIKGDSIENQHVANSIYDFGVNAGPGTSLALSKVADKKSFTEEELFDMSFAIAKIARYASICKKSPVKRKYMYAWIVRTLDEMK